MTLRMWIAVDYSDRKVLLNSITLKDGRLFVLLLWYAQSTDTSAKRLYTITNLLTEIYLPIFNRLPSLSTSLLMSLRIRVSVRELGDCASKSQQLISLIILVLK
jgi:hypothetical protein